MKDIVNILLTKEEIMLALKKALSHQFVDNLRHRHANVQLDSKLRGYVGEFAFKKWMKVNGIEFSASNIKKESNGMDVDFVYQKGDKNISIELKTSLIPDIDQSLEQALERRDIKLIRRKGKSIEGLESNLHVQIIFQQLRLRKDDWLKKQDINLNADPEFIYEQIAAFRYKKDTFLVGWIDKPTLIQLVNAKPQHLQIWKYGMREFWCCNLQTEALAPLQLIEHLRG